MKNTVFTLAVAILFATSAFAKIIRVPADQPTIQAAINAAAKGDTVLVADGTYYENINFKGKAITVASHFLMDADTSHISKTIINGSKPSDPNKGSVVSFTSGEDTTSVICGFTITGGTGTISVDNSRVGGGIFCYSSGPRIIHNKITSNTVTYPQAARGGGIGTFPFGNNFFAIVENNTISLNACVGSERGQGGGIYMPHGRIRHNVIRGNSCQGSITSLGGGIHSACDASAITTLYISNNTIENNRCTNPAGSWCRGGGVDTWEVVVYLKDNTIKNNRVNSALRASGGGVNLWLSSAPSVIQGNTIAFNSVAAQGAGGGIKLWYTQGVQILGNLIEGNDGSATGWGGGGLDESYCSGNQIKGNFIKANTGGWGGGIFATNSLLVNNIIIENTARRGGGVFCAYRPSFTSNLTQIINNTITRNVADTAGSMAINKAKTVVMNTICWGNTAPHGPEIEMWGGTLNAAHSDIRFGTAGIAIDSAATVNWLAGNIDANPLFAFPDHQLSNSSPCIGAGIASLQIGGTTYNCPNSDIEGNPRPNPPGFKPDIGAYENPLPTPQGPILVPEQYASIQAGINAARDGDVVLVRDNTYYENINFKGKAITVASYYLMDGDTTHINNTIINGSKPSDPNKGSVVSFTSGEDTTSVICGFTITGGTGTFYVAYSAQVGGGIFCDNSGGTILANKIINNKVTGATAFGGGLAALPLGSAAYVFLKDNHLMHNTVTSTAGPAGGGGVTLWLNGKLVHNQISYNSVVQNATDKQASSGGVDVDCLNLIMEANKITHNSVVSNSDLVNATVLGGGCFIADCQGRFTGNEVSHNEIWVKTGKNAVGAGMEILGVANSFVIEGNTIRDNAITHGTGWGGGLGFYNCGPAMINNIIAGNTATRGGGLFVTLNVKAQLINNTIVNNKASEYGGGMFGGSSAAPVLMNSIIWNNQSPTHPAIHLEDQATVKAAYCDIQGGWSGEGNKDVDPLLVADSLSKESNCIGAGIHLFDFGNGIVCQCPGKDVNGRSRPYPKDSNPDIGAWESTRRVPFTVGVESQSGSEIPKTYALHQNHPNPFNPSTAIEFALPKASLVTLKIYDLLGNEVATLVLEKLPAGKHQRVWEAKGLASGVYLYRLEAEAFTQTRKLILLR